MARNLIIYGPTGAANPSADLMDPADDSVLETIAMTESPTFKGKYTGVITVAPPGPRVWGVVFKSGTTVLGSFGWALVRNVADEQVTVADRTGPLEVPYLDGPQVKRTNHVAQEVWETLTEETYSP